MVIVYPQDGVPQHRQRLATGKTHLLLYDRWHLELEKIWPSTHSQLLSMNLGWLDSKMPARMSDQCRDRRRVFPSPSCGLW